MLVPYNTKKVGNKPGEIISEPQVQKSECLGTGSLYT
jgi:hypothetical protein